MSIKPNMKKISFHISMGLFSQKKTHLILRFDNFTCTNAKNKAFTFSEGKGLIQTVYFQALVTRLQELGKNYDFPHAP